MARKVKLFFDPKVFLATIKGGVTVADYREGKIVFSQGGPADSVFYIQNGKTKASILSVQGKEAVIAILKSGEFAGEGCLTGQVKRMATLTAMTRCTIARVEKRAMIRMLHNEPMFAEMFISYLLARTVRVEEDLVDQLFNSSEKRLARTLLLLANFGKEGQPEPLLPSISHETLAEMIGTTRPRVSFFMNKFRQLGLIDYNGHIEVHAALLNVILLEKPGLSR